MAPKTNTDGAIFGTEEFTSAVREQAAESIKQTQEFASLVRDQTVASIKQGQQLVLESLSAWTTAVSKLNAQLPQLPGLPSLPAFPAVDGLSKTVEAGFDVAQELLSAQRQLAVSALGALTNSAA
jgi:hypothetical protein